MTYDRKTFDLQRKCPGCGYQISDMNKSGKCGRCRRRDNSVRYQYSQGRQCPCGNRIANNCLSGYCRECISSTRTTRIRTCSICPKRIHIDNSSGLCDFHKRQNRYQTLKPKPIKLQTIRVKPTVPVLCLDCSHRFETTNYFDAVCPHCQSIHLSKR